MKKLEEIFMNSFGFSIGEELLPEDVAESLVPLGGKAEESLLFGSPSASQKRYLVQADIREFIDTAPEGYFLIGFWGHGVNSYAFYYSKVDSWSKVLFRLPYGGVYMENHKMAECIRKFLRNYMRFKKFIRDKALSLIAIDSMSEGYYKLEMPRGKTIELKESLFENPDFQQRLSVI
jgi:hypothetical protein